MQTVLEKNFGIKKAILVLFLFCIALGSFMPGNGHAGPQKKPEQEEIIVVGDRVVDIAYNLGVLPVAMAVRKSLWPLADKIATSSQILGCPNRVTQKRKDKIPEALKEFGVKKLVLSKGHDPYCLYKPMISPKAVEPLVKGMDVNIEYVDFSKGLEPAIRQTAELFGVKDKADGLISAYKQDMQRTKEFLPAQSLEKKVIIISGTFQPSSGKSLLRIEAPGGYADRFLLKPLGCENAGDVFSQGKKPSKGHYMVRKKRGELDLDPLLEANPDIIVMTGDAFAVQKALDNYAEKKPKIKNVKAIKDMAVFSLPGYVDSGVIEYPSVLRKWAVAFSN
ncbi:MAG: ABC transporter substrate-binding protein [Desulfonatronovibrionaceae bacterium]